MVAGNWWHQDDSLPSITSTVPTSNRYEVLAVNDEVNEKDLQEEATPAVYAKTTKGRVEF